MVGQEGSHPVQPRRAAQQRNGVRLSGGQRNRRLRRCCCRRRHARAPPAAPAWRCVQARGRQGPPAQQCNRVTALGGLPCRWRAPRLLFAPDVPHTCSPMRSTLPSAHLDTRFGCPNSILLPNCPTAVERAWKGRGRSFQGGSLLHASAGRACARAEEPARARRESNCAREGAAEPGSPSGVAGNAGAARASSRCPFNWALLSLCPLVTSQQALLYHGRRHGPADQGAYASLGAKRQNLQASGSALCQMLAALLLPAVLH